MQDFVLSPENAVGFVAGASAGASACYLWIVKPLQARLTKAEAQIDALFLMFQKKAMGE